jgi:hypothetical protein
VAWVIKVLGLGELQREFIAQELTIFDLISSASRRGPANPRRKSSHYAEHRIMPSVVVKALVSSG